MSTRAPLPLSHRSAVPRGTAERCWSRPRHEIFEDEVRCTTRDREQTLVMRGVVSEAQQDNIFSFVAATIGLVNDVMSLDEAC